MANGIATEPLATSALKRSLGSCCWFCLKNRREVKKLVESADTRARICDECIGLCNEILGKDWMCSRQLRT